MENLNLDVIKQMVKSGKLRWTDHVMFRLLPEITVLTYTEKVA